MTDRGAGQLPLDQFRTCETEVRNCETTPPRSGQFSFAVAPYLYMARNCETELAGAKTDIAKLADVLPALADARVMLNREYNRLARRVGQNAYAVQRHKLIRYATDAYLPLIGQARATPEAERRAHLAALTARLDRGWDVGGDRADALFADLVPEYEALLDSLLPDALSPLLERIERLERNVA